jgi:hypothetical protein
MKLSLEEIFLITKKQFPVKRFDIEKREMVGHDEWVRTDAPMVFFIKYCIEKGYSLGLISEFVGLDSESLGKVFLDSNSDRYSFFNIKTRLVDNAVNIRQMEMKLGI